MTTIKERYGDYIIEHVDTPPRWVVRIIAAEEHISEHALRADAFAAMRRYQRADKRRQPRCVHPIPEGRDT